MKEYILCAANWYQDSSIYLEDRKIVHQPKNISSGFVVCGRRHHNIVNTVSMLTGKRGDIECIQGFITNTDRFVDRIEALKIATEAEQLNDEPIRNNKLYSENLY